MGSCNGKTSKISEATGSITDTSASPQELLCESLRMAMVPNQSQSGQNGSDLYKFLFTIHPKLQRHFVGAHEFMNEEGVSSGFPGFSKHGQRLLMAVQLLASNYDNTDVFDAHVRDLINRHQQRDVDPEMWKTFFFLFATFLRTKGDVSPATEDAWRKMGVRFNVVAQKQLESLGMPTASE